MVFEEIYKEHLQKIFRLCKGYVNDADVAKDLAQETFITVWEQLPKFRHESAVSTWIFRIATNKCLRSIEKEKRYPKAEFPEHLKEEIKSDSEPQLEMLQRFISELPESDRIMMLLELENVPQAEIAGILGITPANVRVRIHRIKQKLTEKFIQHGITS